MRLHHEDLEHYCVAGTTKLYMAMTYRLSFFSAASGVAFPSSMLTIADTARVSAIVSHSFGYRQHAKWERHRGLQAEWQVLIVSFVSEVSGK